MDLDTAAVDEEFAWHALDPGKLGEDALPHAALGPAPEPVVKRLLGPVDVLRTIAPATAALQSMDNPGEHPTVIDPRHTTRILRQKRFNPRAHCSSENQKKSAICHASSLEAGESHLGAAVNPVYGSGP